MRYNVSIKGVFLNPVGDVVLLLNERDEWELPGGQIEIGEDSQGCLAREIDEELALQVQVGELLDTYLFEVIPGAHVFITTYRCELTGAFEPRLSHEHKRIGYFAPNALPDNLPAGYRRSIQAALAH
ncbi:MAG: 8-oxo-dGTP pyrophosphatase MutT (NUDIX family) [Planctomycetota bacterium]|jgi:8-oxo-dGTP pyrophosphatase MutT (NUDIX family)